MITHDKYLVNVEEEVELFLDIIEPLLNKTLVLLIQLPPSMEIMSGREGLVRVRHHSWIQDYI